MKTICPKFKINFLTYFVFLSFLLTGYIKNILIIFCIILIHECGHVFFLKLFHYKIIKVEIYPYGGLTTTDKLINSPINKDIVIYLGGVLFQILLVLFFKFLFSHHIILETTYKLFLLYNRNILIFNLLPIKPLDGAELIELLLQKYLPFSKAISFNINISIFFLIAFILYNIKSNLNNYIVVSFLIYKIVEYYKKQDYYKNKFYLERYLYILPYKKIEHLNKEDLSLLKKETLHFFKKEKKYRHEKELLKERFDIYTYF